jgi:hypothetical protein
MPTSYLQHRIMTANTGNRHNNNKKTRTHKTTNKQQPKQQQSNLSKLLLILIFIVIIPNQAVKNNKSQHIKNGNHNKNKCLKLNF